jgi:signal peptidase I
MANENKSFDITDNKDSGIYLKISKKLSRISLILTAVLVVGLSSALILNNNTGLFGYTTRIVVSGSMYPSIKINDLALIEVCSIDDINIGDIVCYRNNVDIIHRVKSIKYDNREKTLITKGDANRNDDDINVTSSMLLGKVVKIIKWHGIISSRLKLDSKIALSIAMFICVIIIYIAIKLCENIGLFVYIVYNEHKNTIEQSKDKVYLNQKASINSSEALRHSIIRAKYEYLKVMAVRFNNDNK